MIAGFVNNDALLNPPTETQDAIAAEARRLLEETAEGAQYSPEEIQKKKAAFFSRHIPTGQDTFSPEDAESLLEIRFVQSFLDRLHEFAVKNQDDLLTPTEKGKVGRYLQAVTLLDLLHAKARRALKDRN